VGIQLALIGSGPRAFQRAIDEQCTLPLSPQRVAQNAILLFLPVKLQLLSKEVCCKVSACENFQKQRCSYIIPLFNGL